MRTSRSSTAWVSSTPSCTPCPGRWAARPARTRGRREQRGHLCPFSRWLRGECRGRSGWRRQQSQAAHVEDTPDTPTIETLVALANARYPRPDRPWRAGRHVEECCFHGQGGGRLSASTRSGACPGDREVDLKRLAAQLEPAELRPFSDEDMLGASRTGEGLSRSRDPGREWPNQDQIPGRPRVVSGTRWLTGANQLDHHVFDLVCGRDFTRIARSRPRRFGMAIRHRTAAALFGWREHRDGPHLSAGQGSTRRPSVSRFLINTASW